MRGLAVLAAVLFACTAVAAQSYYADVTFDVDSAGVSAVSGTTNHQSLRSGAADIWTSKRGSYWLFNLTLPEDEVFSDYFIDVRLPSGASVNYVKTSGRFRIATDGDRISVRGTGKDEPLAMVVQYQMTEAFDDKVVFGPYVDYVLIACLVVALAAVVLLRMRGANAVEGPAQAADDAERVSYDPNMLTDRQKEILRVIAEAGRPVNQTLVCERLSLPKSSVSRNVDSLAQMGFITKTRNGMSVMLSLTEKNR